MSSGKASKPTRKDPRSAPGISVRAAFISLLAVVATSFIGIAFFALPGMPIITLGPLAGIIAGLGCRRWWLSAPAAALGVIAGTLLGARFLPFGPGTFGFPAGYWYVAALAALVAAGSSALANRRPAIGRWIVWAGVGFVLLGVCLAGWATVDHRFGDISVTPAEFFRGTPTMRSMSPDEELFVLAIRKMQKGEGYYQAMFDALSERNAQRPGQLDPTWRATAYRMPTLFWFLARVPGGVTGWIWSMIALGCAAVAASWSIASRYVRPSVALVGAVIVGTYVAGFTAYNLPDAEVWAGAIAVIAVALAVQAFAARTHAFAWMCAAAGVALLATLTRELAVGFLLAGLASTLATADVRSRKLWLPWIAALLIAIGAYLGHVAAVAHVASGVTPDPTFVSDYFDPTGRGLAAAITRMALYPQWSVGVAWLVWALGVLGGLLAPRDLPRRVLLGIVTVGGTLAIATLHPMAATGFPVPPMWSLVVFPSLVACVPLALARVPWLRSPRGTGQPERNRP